jgi:hypothetical protein
MCLTLPECAGDIHECGCRSALLLLLLLLLLLFAVFLRSEL